MKADQGRPYTVPTKLPSKIFQNKNTVYQIYIYQTYVEIFQFLDDNIKQRLIIKNNELSNFETLLITNGFTES